MIKNYELRSTKRDRCCIIHDFFRNILKANMWINIIGDRFFLYFFLNMVYAT